MVGGCRCVYWVTEYLLMCHIVIMKHETRTISTNNTMHNTCTFVHRTIISFIIRVPPRSKSERILSIKGHSLGLRHLLQVQSNMETASADIEYTNKRKKKPDRHTDWLTDIQLTLAANACLLSGQLTLSRKIFFMIIMCC